MSFAVISVFSKTSKHIKLLIKSELGELENFKNIIRPEPPRRRTGNEFFKEIAKMDDPRYLPYLWDIECLYFIAEEMNSLNLMRTIPYISPNIMCLQGSLADVLNCMKKTGNKLKPWYVFMSCNDDIIDYYIQKMDGMYDIQHRDPNSIISAVARTGKLKYLKYCERPLLDLQLEIMEGLAIIYENKNVKDFIQFYSLGGSENRDKTDFIITCVNLIEKK
jgi:hypothetical protein